MPCKLTAALVIGSASGFAFVPNSTPSSSTQLNMGLFDGVKEAFSAPALERTTVTSERETPIDRWFGWSVTTEEEDRKAQEVKQDFVDAMEPSNYVAVELEKPMGIVFEENDEQFGGIFVQSLKDGGVAEANGVLQPGDQLVAVGTTQVSGMPFDDALATIVNSEAEKTKLVLFRGSAKQFYGPTGASKAWLEEFVGSGGVDAMEGSS